jgi:hypothetical protein
MVVADFKTSMQIPSTLKIMQIKDSYDGTRKTVVLENMLYYENPKYSEALGLHYAF